MGKKNLLYVVSGLMFLAGAAALLIFGLKPGIDFTGGTLVELGFSGTRPTPSEIQQMVAPLNFGSVTVQTAGEKDAILRMRFLTEDEHQQLLSTVRSAVGVEATAPNNDLAVVEKSYQTIGATISKQLRDRSATASVAIIVVIVGFVAYAFRRVSRPVSSWKYGVAAVVAMIHDVVITAGVFAVLGKYLHVEVDVAFIVAMLTVFGYSVNDTIVVFDRIRENLIRKSAANFEATVNAAINETLARSINTSVTTLLVLVSLFFLGGESIKFFSLALVIGIFLGTYSSIFVASSLLVSWHNWDRRLKA